jgi:hypothetical protein
VIIHQPELIHKDGHALLSARLEMTRAHGTFPKFIWYRVPEQFGFFSPANSDPFLITGLLAGMYFGENIEVKGAVSKKLAFHLEEYAFLLHHRFPKYMHPIEIKYDQLGSVNESPTGVGTTFSGGVDSLFTLWKHLPQNQPDRGYQITHAVFLQGFDILPSEGSLHETLLKKYQQSAKELGVALIPMQTNVVSLTHTRLSLSTFYGPIIVSSAMALSGLFRRFLVPSSGDYQLLSTYPATAEPLMDRLLSTDTLDVIHYGSTHRRVDKVAEIADWEVAQRLLWVCETHKYDKDPMNCSNCEKCIRTMIPIYALGKMDRFKTFRAPIRSNREGLRWARKFTTERPYNREVLAFVKVQDPGFLPWLRLAALLGTLRYWLVVRWLPAPVRQWLHRFGYFTMRNEAPDAYEVPQITRLIQTCHDHPSA